MPRTKKTTELNKTEKPEKTLSLPVFNTEGKESGSVSLPKEIFAAKINKALMAQSVKVFLANQRQGTAKTKTRGDVRGGGKKPWKQKGTGRARQGSTRAPHWKGGGVAFGPQPRDFSMELSDKMKKLAFFSALTTKLKESKIKIVDDLNNLEGKTKNMAKTLNSLNITGTTLLALPKNSQKIVLATRNINNLEVAPANLINTYSVLKNTNILFLKDSLTLLEETFLGKKS
jgi:large subunit ribosomal protein L4